MKNINKIQTNNTNPNLTIVLPGPCQAKCGFCNWKQDDNKELFLKNLKKLIKRLPSNFTQISISGGEPTISPVLEESLNIISKAKKKGVIKKVVLTTNGFKLLEKAPLFENIVDHVNISRHHFRDEENQEIFKTKSIPTINELQDITASLNSYGIDVNFNCVFTESTQKEDSKFITHFIFMAKAAGVSSISFRNQYDDYKPSAGQIEIEKTYKARTEQSCPVCFTQIFLIRGMNVKFHHSSFEPTEDKAFKGTDETYELILHVNGKLCQDWDGKKAISLKKEKPLKKVRMGSIIDIKFENDIPSIKPAEQAYSSCGGGSYSSCGR